MRWELGIGVVAALVALETRGSALCVGISPDLVERCSLIMDMSRIAHYMVNLWRYQLAGTILIIITSLSVAYIGGSLSGREYGF